MYAGIQWKWLRLSKFVLFKSVELNLDHKGVTVVYGSNQMAGRKGHSNGSGKSLLFSAPSQVIYGTNAIAAKVRTRAKKDAFSSGSSVEFVFTSGKHEYSVTKSLDGTSFKYSILRNGVAAKTRTLAYAESKIASIFPISEEEFFALVHLDSRRPATLQCGTPPQRMEFCTSLFRLNNYDEVRKLLTSRLHDLKSERVLYNSLTDSITKSEAELSQVDLSDLSEQLRKAKKLFRYYQRQQSKIQQDISQLQLLQSHYKALCRLRKLVSDIDLTEPGLLRLVKSLSLAVEKEDQNQQLAKEWFNYEELAKSYSTSYATLSSSIRELGLDRTLTTASAKAMLRKSHAQIDLNQTQITQARSQAHKLQTQIDKIEPVDFDLDEVVAKLEKLNASYAALRTKSTELEETLQSLSDVDLDAHSCPTCRQQLAPGHLSSLADMVQTKLKEVQRRLTIRKKQIDKLGAMRASGAHAAKRAELQAELAVLTDQIKTLKSTQKKLAATDLDSLNTFINLQSKLDFLVKPVKPSSPKPVDNEDSARLHESLNLAKTLSPVIESLVDIESTFDVCDAKHIESQLAALTDRLAELNTSHASESLDVIPLLQSKLDATQQLSVQVLADKEKQMELQKRLEDLAIYEMLINAYSNRGLKLLLIQNLARTIEANMNKFAPLLYNEPIRFEFTVSETNFQILYHRTYGKRMSVSDVRTLSGAESRFFNFLLPLSILPLIPASRRCNTIIFDEPLVNLDAPARESFITRFIPALATLIPSVVIITPQADEKFEHARIVKVVKYKGTSTLELVNNA